MTETKYNKVEEDDFLYLAGKLRDVLECLHEENSYNWTKRFTALQAEELHDLIEALQYEKSEMKTLSGEREAEIEKEEEEARKSAAQCPF